MPIPPLFQGRLAVPAIAAPMFLVSGPELVLATCRAGVAGTFPALNARPAEQLDEWLDQLNRSLGPQDAPYGVNLIVHPSNPRLTADLDRVVAHRVPFVITSLGNPAPVVAAVHDYGGLVFSDVIHAKHAQKALAGGADGIICVGAGAGGHAGPQSPFALVREIRQFWGGPLILGGAISDGDSIRAAEALGADLAYLGTRFIATQESRATAGYKEMLVGATADDIVYTPAISGTPANFLWPSLEKAGYTRESLLAGGAPAHAYGGDEAKAWRDVWSAGHGVSGIRDIPPVADLVARLAREYTQACALPPSPALRA